MSTLQQQARALGDPTRHELFRYVADAGRPVDVRELTEHVGLNHNAIRQHLAKLVAAELVSEALAPPAARGRPRLVYELDPRAESRWGAVGPYERLSLWLAEAVRTGDAPVVVGRRAGRRHAAAAADAAAGAGIEVLVAEMARHGFDPVVRQQGGVVDVTLQRCPFATTALADPDTVCQLHLGMAQGIADQLDQVEVDGLVANDPRRAHCRLRCHVGGVA